MEYNYQKLLGVMRERGFTQEQLAKQSNMSVASLNLKLNNKREFRQSEIRLISSALNLKVGDIGDYFFTPKLRFS